MKTFMLLTTVFIIADAAVTDWCKFKSRYDKNYDSQNEENLRLQIFLNNKQMIEEHNEKYRRGEVSYNLEMNGFGDMSEDEFVETMHTGLMKSNIPKHNLPETYDVLSRQHVAPNYTIPDAVDWRKRGAVTPVKNQGTTCGSCWAFSATGALEAHYFRKTGNLISLSEQNLVDCTRYFGNSGCNGGLMRWAFQYVVFNGGLDTEESYPYEGTDYEACRYNMSNVGATAIDYVDLPEGDEEYLKFVLANIGPVSVGIHAGNPSFRFYKSGVYYEPRCDATALDHAALVVGYDTSKFNEDYWLVKNSWGSGWGDSGYIKMARNRDNHCGIVSMASYPLIGPFLDRRFFKLGPTEPQDCL